MTQEQILEAIAKMTVLELSELKKAFEAKFDVSAAAPVAAAAAAPAAAAEEKTEFDVVLADVGASKINVLKAVREATGLGLKEAKDLVDAGPGAVLKAKAKKDEADKIKAAVEAAGGKADIK